MAGECPDWFHRPETATGLKNVTTFRPSVCMCLWVRECVDSWNWTSNEISSGPLLRGGFQRKESMLLLYPDRWEGVYSSILADEWMLSDILSWKISHKLLSFFNKKFHFNPPWIICYVANWRMSRCPLLMFFINSRYLRDDQMNKSAKRIFLRI